LQDPANAEEITPAKEEGVGFWHRAHNRATTYTYGQSSNKVCVILPMGYGLTPEELIASSSLF
jgi:hypothetical protein